MLVYLYKNIWIILERDCSARGEEEKLLFSRVIHARSLLMPRKKQTDRKEDGEPNTKKKRGRKTQARAQ
jgi:hypothetical protein